MKDAASHIGELGKARLNVDLSQSPKRGSLGDELCLEHELIDWWDVVLCAKRSSGCSG